MSSSHSTNPNMTMSSAGGYGVAANYVSLANTTTKPNANIVTLNPNDPSMAKVLAAYRSGHLNPEWNSPGAIASGYYSVRTGYGRDPIHLYHERGCTCCPESDFVNLDVVTCPPATSKVLPNKPAYPRAYVKPGVAEGYVPSASDLAFIQAQTAQFQNAPLPAALANLPPPGTPIVVGSRDEMRQVLSAPKPQGRKDFMNAALLQAAVASHEMRPATAGDLFERVVAGKVYANIYNQPPPPKACLSCPRPSPTLTPSS